jgi:predicted dehydrogenase
MKKIGVVIIGFGYWGPNIARNIALNSNYKLLAVVDQDQERRDLAKSLYGVPTFSTNTEIVIDSKIDLVIICTRPSSHKSLALYFIKQKCHILITKPCGISSAEAIEIASFANNNGVYVFCDFTYHYSPLINFLLKDKSALSLINEMHEFTSYRTSLGIVQSDVDVLADLAVHDVYILLLLKKKSPVMVNCVRTNDLESPILKSAFLTLIWDDGFTASAHVSWNSPKKVRFISIVSERCGVIIEEMNQEAPIKFVNYSQSESSYNLLSPEEKVSRNISFTMGDVEIPKIEVYEALKFEIELISQVLNGLTPAAGLPTASDAANVWLVIEALRASIQSNGAVQNVLS